MDHSRARSLALLRSFFIIACHLVIVDRFSLVTLMACPFKLFSFGYSTDLFIDSTIVLLYQLENIPSTDRILKQVLLTLNPNLKTRLSAVDLIELKQLLNGKSFIQLKQISC